MLVKRRRVRNFVLYQYNNIIFLSLFGVFNVLTASAGAKKKQLLVDRPDDDLVVSKYDDALDDYDFI